jgi:hypothetical protein
MLGGAEYGHLEASAGGSTRQLSVLMSRWAMPSEWTRDRLVSSWYENALTSSGAMANSSDGQRG